MRSDGVGHWWSTILVLDDATNEKVRKIAEGLEKKFQKMSEWDLDKWNENFAKVISNLSEKSSENDKNLALINAIKNEVDLVVKKQQQENDLCKNQYWEGWKEASFFFESDNMISWVDWNKKHTLACEFKEIAKKPVIVIENKPEVIDVYKPEPITDEPVIKKAIDLEPKEIDITEPIQGLYRATKNQYTDTQTSRYTWADVCVQEYWIAWQESKERNADAYIMLYNRYWIETSGYTQYWDWKKLITTPKDKLLHKACVKNTLGTVINDKYRITQWKYRGNILRDWDICKSEYWDEWKVSKEKIAYTQSFNHHSKTYPNLSAWVLYPNDGNNDCGWHHSNNSWNGTVHKMDNTHRQVNRCSYHPTKVVKNAQMQCFCIPFKVSGCQKNDQARHL